MEMQSDLMNLWRSRTFGRRQRHGTNSLSGPIYRSQPFAIRASWFWAGQTECKPGSGAIRRSYGSNGTAIQVAGWISNRGGGTNRRTATSEVCAGHRSNVQRPESLIGKARV